MLHSWLMTPINNAPLVVFRWFFGFLIAAETFGAILTGWVRENLVDPQFTFSFLDLPWWQPLPGNGMYYYFATMGILGLMVMLGYRYRAAMLGFALLWTGAYLMQKSAYNNHYYLLVLLCWLMCLLPAHRAASLDARRQPGIRSHFMPRWCTVVLVGQMAIAYVYGALAKIYPHWLDATFIRRAFTGRYEHPALAALFGHSWFHYFISYGGIFFDLFIIPLLLWRKTRIPAFVVAVFFHLFNSAVFQIGIFPFLSLAFCVFFFPSGAIERRFMPRRSPARSASPSYFRAPRWLYPLLGLYFTVQLLLPLRHQLIEGNVFWTEEGHRMSWRMMLRSKSGRARFYVQPPGAKSPQRINLSPYLTPKQQRKMGTHPDMIWQMAQRLGREYGTNQQPAAVYARCYTSLNGQPYRLLIDPEVNLAAVEWNRWGHNAWIQPFPGWYAP